MRPPLLLLFSILRLAGCSLPLGRRHAAKESAATPRSWSRMGRDPSQDLLDDISSLGVTDWLGGGGSGNR